MFKKVALLVGLMLLIAGAILFFNRVGIRHAFETRQKPELPKAIEYVKEAGLVL